MTDDALLTRFEDASLPNEAFHHQDHVRMAWIYLGRLPVLQALERFTACLRRFAAAKGAPGLYHETITWTFFFLIHERMAQANGEETWEDYARRNPDLLTWKPSILDRYYRRETLGSELARRVFVLPDLVA
jgi:hypothetical protein